MTRLADHYQTDKGTLGHNYTAIYETYLRGARDLPITVLEIGVARGSSLKMWADYFPEGRIYEIDVQPDCDHLCGEYPLVKILIGDASDKDLLD